MPLSCFCFSELGSTNDCRRHLAFTDNVCTSSSFSWCFLGVLQYHVTVHVSVRVSVRVTSRVAVHINKYYSITKYLFSHQMVSVGRYLRQVAIVFSLSNATFHGKKKNETKRPCHAQIHARDIVIEAIYSICMLLTLV